MKRHPGHILAQEFMAPLGLCPHQVAVGLGVEEQAIAGLIAEDERLTPQMAARLGAYFQVPARWWLQMQADYDEQELQSRPELTENVKPLELDPSVLLTPKGVMRLQEYEAAPLPSSLPREELEQLPETSPLVSRAVRVVHYESGSVALVGEEG